MCKKTTILLVPEGDLSLPLAQRRFPYRPASATQVGNRCAGAEHAEANQAITEALNSVRDMVWHLILKSASGWPQHELDDLAADTLAHLCIDSLPRYDSRKKIKVTTFIYSCASRYIYKRIRKHEHVISGISVDPYVESCRADEPESITESDDPQIIAALDIIRHPKGYLDPLEARVISGYAAGRPVHEIAKRISMSRSSVRRIFNDACDRIRRLADESCTQVVA